MKEIETLIEIMFPAEEWGEAKGKWQEGDLRVAAYPLAWLAVAAIGIWIGS